MTKWRVRPIPHLVVRFHDVREDPREGIADAEPLADAPTGPSMGLPGPRSGSASAIPSLDLVNFMTREDEYGKKRGSPAVVFGGPGGVTQVDGLHSCDR